MRHTPDLKSLSDDALLLRLSEILQRVRRDEADLIAHIAEVDARGAYAREAVSSMFAYCVEVLHLSEPEAGLRIHVARTCQKHSGLLEMLRDGRIHLSGISLLAPVLTPENRTILLERATHQPKSRIEEIVAELKPRPRTPVIVRRLQHRRGDVQDAPIARSSGPAALPALEHRPDDMAGSGLAPSVGTVTPPGSEHRPDDVAGQALARDPSTAIPPSPERRPEDLGQQTSASPATTTGKYLPDDVKGRHLPLSIPASRVAPVAAQSFRVHFTASAELKDMLERLQALMRSSVPDGDLGQIIEEAVTEKLERLEAKRFGKTKKPRKSLSRTDTRPKSRHIPAAVRRAVERRDGGRCTFKNGKGRRCTKRHDLEFHHRKPYGFGGDHSPDNLTLMCRTHNNLTAEHDYGKEVMWRHRRRSSSPPPDRTPSLPVSRKRGHG